MKVPTAAGREAESLRPAGCRSEVRGQHEGETADESKVSVFLCAAGE